MIPPLPDRVFLAIGHGFPPEMYLLTTKIQGILWSSADIVFIFCLLQIADLIRRRHGRAPIRIRYFLLLLSALPIPWLVFTDRSLHFFLIECVVFGLQLSIMVYTIVAHIREIMIFFRNIILENMPRE